VTANARVVGPNYRPYLTDRWEEPYRTARIYDLLHDRRGLRLEDMLKVETDTYSYPHVFLAEQLLAAAKTVKPKDPRTQKLMDGLTAWNGIADANSPEISFLHNLRLAALKLILEPVLGEEAGLYQWRSMTFLQKTLTGRPSKWLPAAYKNYDELLVAAADLAVKKLAEDSRSEHVEDWAWKNFDSLEMFHPLGHEGFLKTLLSIAGKPQSGTVYSVRAATKTHGPAMRFVANPANWDESILLIPSGESGQLGSRHYADQFSYWYEGKPILARFSAAAEAKAKKHTLILEPGLLTMHFRLDGQLVWFLDRAELLERANLKENGVHVDVALEFAKGVLGFADRRHFGRVYAWGCLEDSPGLTSLGIDALSKDFAGPRFLELLAASARPLKDFLLDQTRVAG